MRTLLHGLSTDFMGETKFNINLDDDDEDEFYSSDDDKDEIDSSDDDKDEIDSSEDDKDEIDSSDDDENTFESDIELFVIIIMDALDPKDMIEFRPHYTKMNFFGNRCIMHFHKMVYTLGADKNESAEELTKYKNRAQVRKTLGKVGFRTAHVYDETFLIACKRFYCLSDWYKNLAQVEHAIYQRIKKSKLGLPLLQNFDGSTFSLYQFPHRTVQTTFCRTIHTPPECVPNRHKAFEAPQQLGEIFSKPTFSFHLSTLAISAVKNNLKRLLILDNFSKMDNDFTSTPVSCLIDDILSLISAYCLYPCKLVIVLHPFHSQNKT